MKRDVYYTHIPEKSYRALVGTEEKPDLDVLLVAAIVDPLEAEDIDPDQINDYPHSLADFRHAEGAKGVDRALGTVTQWVLVQDDVRKCFYQIARWNPWVALWIVAHIYLQLFGQDPLMKNYCERIVHWQKMGMPRGRLLDGVLSISGSVSNIGLSDASDSAIGLSLSMATSVLIARVGTHPDALADEMKDGLMGLLRQSLQPASTEEELEQQRASLVYLGISIICDMPGLILSFPR